MAMEDTVGHVLFLLWTEDFDRIVGIKVNIPFWF
jgi:hypothetical protein